MMEILLITLFGCVLSGVFMEFVDAVEDYANEKLK